MTKFQVTLADLRKNGACVSGYNKIVRMIQGEKFSEEDAERGTRIKFKHESPILLSDIARNNGIEDALWTLRCIPGIDRDSRLFAVWCARQVEHLMADERSKEALNIAERYANGHANAEELASAWAASWSAASDAALEKTWAAVVSSWAALAASLSVAWEAALAASRVAARASTSESARTEASEAQLEMLIAMCEGRAPWQK